MREMFKKQRNPDENCPLEVASLVLKELTPAIRNVPCKNSFPLVETKTFTSDISERSAQTATVLFCSE
jgi:hypothetical protein